MRHEFPIFKVRELCLPQEVGGRTVYFHWVKWYSFDGVNDPTEHAVQGPLFTKRGGDEELNALDRFSKIYHDTLLKFPPCDREKVRAERTRRKGI